MEKKTDFKALSTRAKFDYIWDYYKLHILAAIIAVCVVVSLIHHYVTYREPILNVIMINCIGGDLADDSGFDEFLESYGHDPAKEPVSLSSNLYFSENSSTDSYTNMQVLAAMMAAGDQDLFFGTGDIYLSYADQGALADLSAVLPADILEQYKDSLIYTTEDGTRVLTHVPSSSVIIPGFLKITTTIPVISAFSTMPRILIPCSNSPIFF